MIQATGSPHSDAPAWHSLPLPAVIQKLQSDPDCGLTSQQVTQRQREYGPNELISSPGRSAWQLFLDQFRNVMLLMLIAVAAISALLDLQKGEFPKDALAILLVVGLMACWATCKKAARKRRWPPEKTGLPQRSGAADGPVAGDPC
jgi:Ca2+-transporting ATPase